MFSREDVRKRGEDTFKSRNFKQYTKKNENNYLNCMENNVKSICKHFLEQKFNYYYYRFYKEVIYFFSHFYHM